MFNYKASPFPDIVRLELTNTCNLKCPHCRHHSPEKRLPENYPKYYNKICYKVSNMRSNNHILLCSLKRGRWICKFMQFYAIYNNGGWRGQFSMMSYLNNP